MSDPMLIKACKLWDKLTTNLVNYPPLPEGERFYESQDYHPLSCSIIGKKVEMVVGSSPGHRTHLDADEGKLNYYDTDSDVNRVLKDLLEDEAGLKCKRTNEGVSCTGLEPERFDDAFSVIAMATSMDVRLERCERMVDMGLDPKVTDCEAAEKQTWLHVKKLARELRE